MVAASTWMVDRTPGHCSVNATSRARRWRGLSVYVTRPLFARASATRWTLCRASPRVRAIPATVAGPSSMLARTCQRAVVCRTGRVRASPSAARIPLRRNSRTTSPLRASPAGLRPVERGAEFIDSVLSLWYS